LLQKLALLIAYPLPCVFQVMDSERVSDVSSQPFYKAVVFIFLFYQMIKQKKVCEACTKLYFYNGITIMVSFGCIIHTTIYPIIHLSPSFSSIYIETGVVVVISYVLLLGVNWDYIWLAAFPLIAIGFIFTLCRQQSGLPQQRDDDGRRQQGSEEEIEKAERLEAAALVLYWVLCIMGSLRISDDSLLAVSQFLLFFSFVLGALTRMMTRLALAGAGVAAATEGLARRAAGDSARFCRRASGRERRALPPPGAGADTPLAQRSHGPS
jgi:hypothetical protein